MWVCLGSCPLGGPTGDGRRRVSEHDHSRARNLLAVKPKVFLRVILPVDRVRLGFRAGIGQLVAATRQGVGQGGELRCLRRLLGGVEEFA